MNKLISALILAAAVGVSGCASAGPHWARHDDRHDLREVARVVAVEPIYETVRIAIPRERCWEERHPHVTYRDRNSYTGPLVGAIVGGVVGNRFGGGSGKTAMTIAGTLLGASIANDLDNGTRSVAHRPRRELRCETVDEYETREEIVAYRVKYRYKGHIYHTRMDHDPGDTIRLNVTVDPVD
jgi:uncharacterized protein YcfJ